MLHQCFNSTCMTGIDQTNQVCSNDDQGRVYENCKGGVSIRSFFGPLRIGMKI